MSAAATTALQLQLPDDRRIVRQALKRAWPDAPRHEQRRIDALLAQLKT